MGFDVVALCKEIKKIYDDLINLEIKTASGEKKKLLTTDKWNLILKKPGWLHSCGVSVRDCVLESYGADPVKGMICKTSAIYTTQATALDLDHFFSASRIQRRLEELKEENSGATLKSLKQELATRATIPPRVLSQLISDCAPSDIKGLHTLYYNARSNIWPMAGTINSGKGSKDSFSETTEVMLKSTLNLYGLEYFKGKFLNKLKKYTMFLDLTIDPGSSSEQLIEQITKHVTEKLSISLDENTTVLPQYSDQKTMLEKFLDSDLVKLIVEHREQEKALLDSTLRNISYINPENVSIAELLVFRKISRSLVKKLSKQEGSGDVSGGHDTSNISSQPLTEEQSPIAFQMLEMVLKSLKEDAVDEKKFIELTMLALRNSVENRELQGAIDLATEAISSTEIESVEEIDIKSPPPSREGSDQQDPRSLAEVAQDLENTQSSSSLLLSTEELTPIVKRTVEKVDSDSDVKQLSSFSKKPKLDR